ncbi:MULTISPECIES: hypothetical protein [Paenibacillus]|uniref:hypothetical protein n=1 Tax=Paenibacillus TaxID=44249 RepID=UPI000A8FF02E|nr:MULTISPECIES: hypothetical protein [Paenibacillus]QYK64669.1 hypothetical protein KAI37_05057 [Paenibacillus sp. S25]
MSEPFATMFVFAGNNGSGKSTIRNLIVKRDFTIERILADSWVKIIDSYLQNKNTDQE